MIGEYTSIGIVIRPEGDKWALRSPFQDAGFCDDASSEGTIHLRYYVSDLSAGIDTLRADVERLGIRWNGYTFPDGDTATASIYMDGNGKDLAIEYPANWREIVKAQCNRLGWRYLYGL